MRAANGKVQEADRVENWLRDAAKGIANGFRGELGCLGAVGVATHAIDGDQENRLLPGQHLDTILILLTVADQAEICVFNAQGHSN